MKACVKTLYCFNVASIWAQFDSGLSRRHRTTLMWASLLSSSLTGRPRIKERLKGMFIFKKKKNGLWVVGGAVIHVSFELA